MPIILIGGGSRSGKSRYALDVARRCGGKLGFVATAQAYDEEMTSRIAHHQAERGPDFETIEEPRDLAGVLRERNDLDAIVIDCLTLWISNAMMAGEEPAVDAVLVAAANTRSTSIFVTNEVGCGIVPDNELARRFRDIAGSVNQRVASVAQEVYWMVFGIPLRVR